MTLCSCTATTRCALHLDELARHPALPLPRKPAVTWSGPDAPESEPPYVATPPPVDRTPTIDVGELLRERDQLQARIDAAEAAVLLAMCAAPSMARELRLVDILRALGCEP